MDAGPAAAGPLPCLLLLVLLLASAHSAHALPAAAASAQQHRLLSYQPQLLHYGSSVAPILSHYNFSSAVDTFDICRQQAGMVEGQEVTHDDLLQQFRLPKDLNKHKHLTLPQLVELLHSVQPEFRVVFEPMLSGEADIGRLVDPNPQPQHSLPRLVHFTVKDKNKLQPHQVLAMASWAFYNPGYSLMLFDDADIRAFMTTYYPHLLPTFDGLGSPVERTDLWRYLVLCRMGGVYADSDVMAARPISQWAQDAGLLVGIENVFTTPEEARQRSYSRQVQMVQWSIAARPGHPVVCRMGQYVAQHVAEERAGEFVDPDRNHAILERTGPGIWSDSVHDYLRQVANISVEQMIGGGRVGDVRILPQPVFGCPTGVFHAADPLPYVYHMFMGSWKISQPSGLSVFIRKLSSTLHRPQQLKESPAAGAASASAAAVAGTSAGAAAGPAAGTPVGASAAALGAGLGAGAAAGQSSAHPHKHPRRPVLEEQIMQHKAQQQNHQHDQHPQQQPQHHKQQDESQQQAAPQHQVQQQAGLVRAAAAAGQPVARKLRAAQPFLVRAPTLAVPNMVHGMLTEPEVPSRALGSMPTLSVLVVAVLLVTLYKRQRGGAGASGLWLTARDSMRAARSAVGLPPRSPLTRPHSRTLLTAGAGGNALLVCPMLSSPLPALAGAGAGAASAPGCSKGGVLPVQEAVLHSSSQHAARGHGHKRSWGSATSFQL